jgi:hypothetical protein
MIEDMRKTLCFRSFFSRRHAADHLKIGLSAAC